jgi:GTPase
MLRRRVLPSQLISADLAQLMVEFSQATGRQVGVLLTRRGQVEQVVVGEAQRTYLPDLGKVRAAHARLSGIRHVHTAFKATGLSEADLSDLKLLRLDAVAVIDVTTHGAAGALYYGMLAPPHSSGGAVQWREERAASLYDLDLDASAAIIELEEALGRLSSATTVASADARAKAVLVHVGTHGRASAERSLAELRELARTARLAVVDEVVQLRTAIDNHYVMGRGRLEETVLSAGHRGASMLVFDRNLSPSQLRAIANFTALTVIDRTQLILMIFAEHAVTRDGKLQVELAQLKYTLPRLVEKDTAMSRIVGGARARGPGETKLEVSRRRARDRISALEREIDAISRQRGLRRSARRRSSTAVVSIVGYTNAGKSTLLNRLTGADVVVEDKLFATLDPVSRKLHLPRGHDVVITDTVGFIRDLPLDLIAAFRATLEELTEANLLVHVVDASDAEREEKADVVLQTLRDLHVEHIPCLTVYNKADRIDREQTLQVRRFGGLIISAANGEGLDALLRQIELALYTKGGATAGIIGPLR